MKKMKGRMLSLLMAVVMICTLAPVGMAVTTSPPPAATVETITWASPTCREGASSHTIGTPYETTGDCTTQEGVTWRYKCVDCEAIGTYNMKPASRTHTLTRATPSNSNHGRHTGECTVCGNIVEDNCNTANNGACSICGYDANAYSIAIEGASSVKQGNSTQLTANVTGADKTGTMTWESSDETVATVVAGSGTGFGSSVRGVKVGTATITAKYTLSGRVVATKTYPITVTNPLIISSYRGNYVSSTTFTSMNDTITLSATLDNGVNPASPVTWSFVGVNSLSGEHPYFYLSAYSGNSVYVTPKAAALASSTCTIQARVTGSDGLIYTQTVSLSMNISTNISLSATVNDEYYFSDVSNAGTYSVAQQLTNALNNLYYNYDRPSYWDYYVRFQDVSVTSVGRLDGITTSSSIYASDFGNVKFVPVGKGTATFRFTVYVYNSYYGTYDYNATYSGVLTITVTDTVSGGDVTFYGNIGEDVYLGSAEFDDFWDKKFPSGTLNYVTFGSISGGSLLDASGSAAGSRQFYASASRGQVIDDVHFRPNSTNAAKAVTLTFPFTAYGQNRSGTSTSASGTVKIVYLSKNPSDIKYTVGTNGTVSLKASDFTAAYREATGSTAPSNMTVVFQGVPSNGSLTYTDSSKSSSSSVTLTSSNIRSRNFTMSGTGSNQIGDVVYTNTGTGTDTIEYIAYSGNTVKYRGRVVFSGRTIPTDISVTYQSTNGQQVQFSWADFTSKNTALSNASKVRFSAPVSGTLYLNGSAISASTDILVTQVSGVTYVPRTGTNGQERLTFTAMDASNQTVGSGTVVITVTGNAAPTTPAPTTPSGVTSASQFTDVTTGAWYYQYLDDLVRKGIVSGRDDGSFDPNGTVTYGEALKLVLEAAGHSATATTGNEWAINYKNLAVQRGWISNDIVLTAPIPRLATAELIARVLGLGQYAGDSPFADTANGYAAALYYTNPKIFIGNDNPSGGKPLFNNSTRTTLTRAEVCTVIYRMNAYYLSSQSSQTAPTNQSSQANQNNQTNTPVDINPSTGLPYGI